MSAFLPEQSQNAPSGITEFSPANPQTTTEDVALMQRVFQAAAQNPLMLPADFMAYLFDYIQTSRLQVPIGQVFGFSQFTANVAPFIVATEATTATSYGDLATVGPVLTGIPDGKYLLLYGSQAYTTGGAVAFMSVQVNSTAAGDDDSAASTTGAAHSVMMTKIASLSNGSNTITAKYRELTAGQTATFQRRWLVALKFANL